MDTLNEILSYGGMSILFAVTIIPLLIFLRSVRRDIKNLEASREQEKEARRKIVEQIPANKEVVHQL